jgi:carbon-monoxide dehydrogenase large subunit
MERVLDLVAAHLRLDPALVRRRNLVGAGEMPYRTATGLNLDSGDYARVLDTALDLLGYERWRRRQAQAREAGRLVGVGIAFELTPEASNSPNMLGSGRDSATVRVDAAGRVTVLTGVTSPGGGNETGIAQVVADELGRAPEEIVVVQGDTARCPPGSGNYSGRSTVLGASAAALAARDVRGRLERGEPLPVEATHEYLPGNTSQVPDERGRIQPYPTYSNAAFAVVAEVDPDTGAVALLDLAVCHDCGTVLNPRLVEGQMHGAVAMGVGMALSEQLVYDERGVLRTDRFKSYLLPRASDMVDVRIAHVETPSPFTLLGTKGAGEAGVGGTQAAIANAVADALAPLRVAIRALPLTPPAVLSLLRDAPSRARPTDRQRTGAA